MEYVPCIGNSSNSFWWILLKLYRCFKDGLEICILFFQNPEIIFYHFFCIFNLDIFRALILQICIGSICLVSATPPTVLGQSFWNFTGTLQLSFDFTWEICHLLDIIAVAGHLAWLGVLFGHWNFSLRIKNVKRILNWVSRNFWLGILEASNYRTNQCHSWTAHPV